jgi:hypothetical protein
MNNAEATWEPVEEFKTHFPSFQLEGELFIEGGVMLWWGTSTNATRGAVDERWTVAWCASAQSPTMARCIWTLFSARVQLSPSNGLLGV